MHVLIVPSGYPMEGKPYRGIFYKEQAIALSKAGYRVTVAFPEIWSLKAIGIHKEKDKLTHEVEDGVVTYRYKGFNIFGNAPYSTELIFKKRLKSLYKQIVNDIGKPDIIHAHSCLWGGYGASELSEKENLPLVITEHSSAFGRNMLKSYQKTLAKTAFKKADEIISVGPGLKKDLESYTDKNIRLIPNFIEMDQLTPKESNVSTSDFRILIVANLNTNKGIDLLITAFAQAFNQGDETLRIGGMGEEEKHLKKLVKEYGLESRVTFLGALSREDVLKEMIQADVFVSSSYYETFGVALVEALAVGTPIIATDSGGPSMIVNDLNGLLVQPGSVSELANGLIYMKNHQKDYNPVTIHDDCKKRFGKQAVINELGKIYNKLV
ncbi:glycosyltransferase [Guptibacillus algicola]|uniref:glycosyltransferase n=1 Tax=Guptibacillus algicola TaxID=225844 RepID=UPI001CD2A7B7|nr:glycosyltransferase [Alkalihalobacillus algicola]MCA0986865.1 glycosyltransferase [Alkalihalobacillus algicola]